jgi:hypothetical protein
MKWNLMATRTACLGLTLAVAGCWAGNPFFPTTPAATEMAAATVVGRVTFPAGLVNGAHIIPTGIGAVIAAGGARYRTLAIPLGATTPNAPSNTNAANSPGPAVSVEPTALPTAAAVIGSGDTEFPVVGALVIARDPSDQSRLSDVGVVRTDAQGQFRLAIAGNTNVLLEVLFRSPDNNRGFRMLALAHPHASQPNMVGVNWRSTLALAPLLAVGAPSTDLRTLDVTALPAREAATAEAALKLAPAARLEALARALGIDAAAVPTGDVPADQPAATAPPLVVLPGFTASAVPPAAPAFATPVAGVGVAKSVATSAVAEPAVNLPSVTPVASPDALPKGLPSALPQVSVNSPHLP